MCHPSSGQAKSAEEKSKSRGLCGVNGSVEQDPEHGTADEIPGDCKWG